MSLNIVGPSHVKQMMEIKRPDVKIFGLQSCPIFVEELIDRVKNSTSPNILFVTTSHRFNMYHEKFKEIPIMILNEVYHNDMDKCPFIFDRTLLHNKEVVSIMDNHLCMWLDRYIEMDPNIKFVFLCEFFTHHKRKNPSGNSSRLLYNDFVDRYSENCIDMYQFLSDVDTPIEELANENLDHLKREGSALLVDWLNENFGD